MRRLAADWRVTTHLPGALRQYRRDADMLPVLRRDAARSDLVLHLSPDGAAELAGLEGLVEVYAPIEPALCRPSAAVRQDPLAWEALWRRERDLARRAGLVVVPTADAALVMRLLYGVPPGRLRVAPPEALPGLLPLAFADRPHGLRPCRFTLALNDYPVLGRHTGGAIRIREGLAALGRETLLLCLGQDAAAVIGPGLVQVCVPKQPGQTSLEADLLTLTGQALEDLASAMHAPDHPGLTSLAADLASRADLAIFEHCYLAPLLDSLRGAAPDLPIVYDAHNVETRLKRELLQAHPARAALCGFVAETERRLLEAAALVLACSEGDAEEFRTQAREVVLMPHGIVPAVATLPETPRAKPRIGFIGSGHPPNVAAARFILEELAPRVPEAVFEILGGVCSALVRQPANVVLHGTLPEADKSQVMAGWVLALNPVEGGGGASLKVADYLSHGLPSLNTPHAARGFPVLQQGAGAVLPLADFAPALQALLQAPRRLQQMARCARDAATAQGWPEVATAARQVVARLADGAVPPPPPQPLLDWDETSAAAGRRQAGAARRDILSAATEPLPLVDRGLVPPEPPGSPRPPESQGIGKGGRHLARRFTVPLPAGTRRLALDLRAKGPVRLQIALRGETCRHVLLRTELDGACQINLPLAPGSTAVPVLEGEILSGPASALQIRAMRLIEPGTALLPLPAGDLATGSGRPSAEAIGQWRAPHAGHYCAVPSEATENTLLSALIADAGSARRMAAQRAALGLTDPFLLLLADAAPAPHILPAGLALVRHNGSEAISRDADGVERRVAMPVAALILPRQPACRGIIPGPLPPAERRALQRLAGWAEVPILDRVPVGAA
jgi:hypothetical protein